jgi:hypothetical protein
MGRFSDQMLLPYNGNGTPGYKEKTTSRDAAHAVGLYSSDLRERVFQAIKNAPNGLTADESALAIGSTPLACRPRLSELREIGRIIPLFGTKRPSSTGRPSRVWIVAPTSAPR